MSESISIPAGAPPGFEDIEPAPMTEIVPSATITLSVTVATETIEEAKTTNLFSLQSPPTLESLFPVSAKPTSSFTDPTTFITRTSSSAASISTETAVSSGNRSAGSRGLPIGAIIGIVIGVLVLFMGTILLRALLLQHKALKSGIGSPHYRDHLIPGFVSARIIPTQETTAAEGEKTADTGGVHELAISEAKPNELPASEVKHGNVAETYELPP